MIQKFKRDFDELFSVNNYTVLALCENLRSK